MSEQTLFSFTQELVLEYNAMRIFNIFELIPDSVRKSYNMSLSTESNAVEKSINAQYNFCFFLILLTSE